MAILGAVHRGCGLHGSPIMRVHQEDESGNSDSDPSYVIFVPRSCGTDTNHDGSVSAYTGSDGKDHCSTTIDPAGTSKYICSVELGSRSSSIVLIPGIVMVTVAP
jgi:hypothetical protein